MWGQEFHPLEVEGGAKNWLPSGMHKPLPSAKPFLKHLNPSFDLEFYLKSPNTNFCRQLKNKNSTESLANSLKSSVGFPEYVQTWLSR